MRWIRCTVDNETHYGIVQEERVQLVRGNPFEGYEARSLFYPLDAVKIEVPVVPKTFYCAGLNYTVHITEAATKRGEEPKLPKKAEIGYRANNALIAHNEAIIVPADATEHVHYEGELVVVIGKKARHLNTENALDCVLGYTIGNDVSERTWQKSDRTFWRSKNTDTFKPMGPWIETDFDLSLATTTVRVNGTPSTEFATGNMLFGIKDFLVAMTQYITLWPGDVVWMGTDGTSPSLKHDDVVEVEISGIGTLRNTISREGRAV